MGDIVFPIIAGTAFVILGRWMYRNPQKVYPTWVASRADSQFYPRLVKVFAVLAMFVGSYAPVAAMAAHILPPLIAVLAAFAAAFAGTWLLRPKMTQRA